MLLPKSQIRLGRGTPPHGQHRQSCWRQAMTRPPQHRRLIRATTPQACIWHRIRATTTTIHLPVSVCSWRNMGARSTNCSRLLLKYPTLLQKTFAIHLVAGRYIATSVDYLVLRRRLQLLPSPRLRWPRREMLSVPTHSGRWSPSR